MKCPICFSKSEVVKQEEKATVFKCTYIVCGTLWKLIIKTGKKEVLKEEEYKSSNTTILN
jgi:uncharacterized Zn finger protein